jgi:hypothetical protein
MVSWNKNNGNNQYLHGYSQESLQWRDTPYHTKDYSNDLPDPINYI